MKSNLLNKQKIILIIFLLACANTIGQTNEIGVFLGGSLFKGDIGVHRGEYIINNTKPTFGFQFKRNLNYHFGISFNANKGELYSDDSYSNDVFELARNLNFRSKITELSLLLEFNFRPYMSRDPEYNTSPFVFAGITKFFFNPQGKYSDGVWYDLRPIGTEGQGSDFYPNKSLYELNGIAIPFGFGYKINVYDFLTLSLNFSWRITFTDYLDDVSNTYIDLSRFDVINAELADQSKNKFSPGFQRGNPYNNDKYGFIGLHILYSIKDPKKECNNIVY